VLDGNVGFGAACNRGLQEARNEIVLLLNSDMEVMPGSVWLLLEHFSDPDVFAAGPRYAPPGQELALVDDGLGLVRPQLGSPAGGGLFARSKFLKLGGFDPLYHPFYWEDLDLGWNAWRCGWRIVLDGRACFIHRESATIRRLYSQRFVTRVRARNRCLFGWKNLGDRQLFLRFMGRSLGRAAKGLLVRGTASELLGVVQSIPHVRPALARRATTPGPGDREILDASATPFSRLNAV
jgi:GT2 family glycosyltransferase